MKTLPLSPSGLDCNLTADTANYNGAQRQIPATHRLVVDVHVYFLPTGYQKFRTYRGSQRYIYDYLANIVQLYDSGYLEWWSILHEPGSDFHTEYPIKRNNWN